MNPTKQGCNILGCFLATVALWFILAFFLQWFLWSQSPSDTGFYPNDDALTYASYTTGAVVVAVALFSVYHYCNRGARRGFEPLSYDLN